MQIKLKERTVDVNKSRPWGYPLMSVMYVLVGLIAVLVYLTLPFGILANLAIANICAIAIIFIASTCFDNASIFDPLSCFDRPPPVYPMAHPLGVLAG